MDEETPATTDPRLDGVPHRVVRTELPESAEQSATLQAIPLGALLRSIVVRRGENDYLFVLVPGGRQFNWPRLRAHLGVNRLSLPDADEALAATGYVRYTITPFGSTTAWPTIVDAAAMEHPVVSVGAGVRGLNLHFAPANLVAALGAAVVDLTDPVTS